MPQFTPDVLKINLQTESERMSDFIKKTIVGRMHKKGAVVGLSGGIDSAVSAALSVKAFGPDKVLGILLPEKDSNPLSEQYARLHADRLGISTTKVDMTATVEAFGSYRNRDQVVRKLFPAFDPSTWRYKIVLPQDLLERDSLNIFYLVVQPPDGTEQKKRLSPQDFLQIVASTNIRQRTRMIYLYYFAEKNNYAVIGTTNRTEAREGFFVKYGDGGVDIEPLAHLYKTQVYAMGEYLGVPDEIIKRPPSPDTYTAEVSDTEFYFSVPFNILDPFLWADEHNVPQDEVCKVLSLTAEQYQRLKRNIDNKAASTWHFLQTPPTI
jgi:NAD+ synthase